MPKFSFAFILISILNFALASTSWADDRSTTSDINCSASVFEGPTCDGPAGEIQECLGTAFAIADKELQTVYSSLIARLRTSSANDKEDALSRKEASEIDRRLVASEGAWIAFRDADCDLQATEMLGRNSEGPIAQSCRVERTKERLKELKCRG